MLHDIDMVLHAYQLAAWAHKGQLYTTNTEGGLPYIHHVAQVVQRGHVKGAGLGETAVAWLHDVVEDTSITQEIINMEFPTYVSLAVEAIIRIKEEETYLEYIQRVRTNAMARFVKLSDLAENISNCKGDEDWSVLLRGYEKAVIELGGASWGILDEAL